MMMIIIIIIKAHKFFFYSSCREEMFWSWNSKAECDFRDLTSANIIIKVMLIPEFGNG